MLRHVVLLTWTDDVDDDHVAGVAAALDALSTTIAAVVAYRHGPDLGLAEGNADYAIVADFADQDGWTTYRDHPRHLAFLDDHLAGRVARRTAVQVEVPDVEVPAAEPPPDAPVAGAATTEDAT